MARHNGNKQRHSSQNKGGAHRPPTSRHPGGPRVGRREIDTDKLARRLVQRGLCPSTILSDPSRHTVDERKARRNKIAKRVAEREARS